MADQVAALEAIFADQRALLARHVNPRAETVPQVFTPYKEVLGKPPKPTTSGVLITKANSCSLIGATAIP